MQMKRDTFIFSYKGNLILLFFSRSKFNERFASIPKFVIFSENTRCKFHNKPHASKGANL